MKTKLPISNGFNEISQETPPDEVTEFYIRFFEAGVKVRPAEVMDLGYRFTARYFVVAQEYKLFELLSLKTARPANACFLSTDNKHAGVVIPYSFQEHKAKLRGRTLAGAYFRTEA